MPSDDMDSGVLEGSSTGMIPDVWGLGVQLTAVEQALVFIQCDKN